MPILPSETKRVHAYWTLSLSTGGLLALLLASEPRSQLLSKFLVGFLSFIAVVSLATITLVDMPAPPPWGIIRSMDCLLRGLVAIFILTLFAALASEPRSQLLSKFLAGFLSFIAVVSLATITLVDMRAFNPVDG